MPGSSISIVKASFIIPSYQLSKYMHRVVDSICAQSFAHDSFEVIIVDNNPNTNDISDWVNNNSGKYKTTIKCVKEPNIGLHNARHAGCRAASAPILCFVDDDACIDPYYLNHILDCFADENVGIIGGRVILVWEMQPAEWVLKMNLRGNFGEMDLGTTSFDLPAYEGVSGASFSIRKNLVFDLGGFNPGRFGDVNKPWLRCDSEGGLCFKAHVRKITIRYCADALAYHQIPENRLKLDYIRKRLTWTAFGATYSNLKRYGMNYFVICFLIVGRLAKYLGNFGLGKHRWAKRHYELSCILYLFRLLFCIEMRKQILRDDFIND